VVGQASDQAIRTSRAGVAAGRRRTHQLQGIRGPRQDRLACGAESLRSHDHNRGGTNSASQPQASQHEPYRSLSSLVPNSAEVAHEDLFAPTRTAADKDGQGSRRAAMSFSGLRLGLLDVGGQVPLVVGVDIAGVVLIDIE
jgi:hypothetical protein